MGDSYGKDETSVSGVIADIEVFEHLQLNTGVVRGAGSGDLTDFTKCNGFITKAIDEILSQCCCLYGSQLLSLSGLEDFFILINAVILVLLNGYNFSEEVFICFVIGSSVEMHLIYSFLLSVNMFLLLLSERGPDLYVKVHGYFQFFVFNSGAALNLV